MVQRTQGYTMHRTMQKKEIQSGILQHTYGKKIVNNDDIVTRARKLEPEVQQHWLKDYVSQTFKFFGEDRLGLIADILFTFDKITKLNETRTILVGYVIYNDIEINGDGIIVNTQTGVVKYKDKKSSYEYTLEVDIRSKMKWNELLEQIKIALANQQK